MEQKTISVGVLSAIIGSLLMLGGVGLLDDDIYYCEETGVVMHCDGFSKYVSEYGKCLNEEGNKICREGWQKVEKDTIVERTDMNCSGNCCTGGVTEKWTVCH